jgi:predicted phosphodiesterase
MSKHSEQCLICLSGTEYDNTLTHAALARQFGVSEGAIRRHRKAVNREEARLSNPDEFFGVPKEIITSRGKTVRLPDGSYEKIHYDPSQNITGAPAWPVIDRPAPLPVPKATGGLIRKWKTAVAGADSQIGFRNVDGELDPFHDAAAMALFTALVEIENPDRVVLAGDIIDLAEQGRWTQEAGFALTTQASIDATYRWLYDLRDAAPSALIDLIEGNHDKRLQNFVEINAKSAFGLKRAGWPDEWPVMSIPYLLRLDELKVTYHDAYPNAHVWINNNLRAEHGTKVNSNGSTAQRYLNETPHVSRLFGHTHRQEVVQRTTWDRMGKIRSQAINPGCLCRVDGAVPGVHSSIGANGKPATYYEDWQQGAAVIRYTDDEFFVELVQFDDGKTFYQGQELSV